MINEHSIPPLRLVLNNACNGNCAFCHSEGVDYCQEMSIEMVYDCVDSAEKLSITQIALTGGEPTLRNDLKDIIVYIQNKQKLSISLTSNGFRLKELSGYISRPIDKLNVSMSSLKDEIAERYQNVKPSVALDALSIFPAKHKTINLVITKENYTEIDDFIRICKEKKISLDLMFEDLKDKEYICIQKEIITDLLQKYEGNIVLKSTPILLIRINEECVVRIKHPYLSKLLHNGICDGCVKYNECFEKVCAIRVHPSGVVTPCLIKEICFEGDSIYARVQKAYTSLHAMVFDSQFYD